MPSVTIGSPEISRRQAAIQESQVRGQLGPQDRPKNPRPDLQTLDLCLSFRLSGTVVPHGTSLPRSGALQRT